MTLPVLVVTALIAAWARDLAKRLPQPGLSIFAGALEIAFTGIAIGAGIQLLFRG